jgi:hypothetical protein
VKLALLGIAIAASTVWEILTTAGVDPAPQRAKVTWASFLRSQAEAILAMDFLETVTFDRAASGASAGSGSSFATATASTQR